MRIRQSIRRKRAHMARPFSSRSIRRPELKSVKEEPTLHDPYQEMPTALKIMINPRGPINKDSESIFVTLGRYGFPRTKERLLPGISLATIYNKAKHLVLRWKESPDYLLTPEEEQFFDSLFLKGVDAVEMGDWEYLRDIFVARDGWFKEQRNGRNFQGYKVTVKQLPPGIQLMRHLPPTRTLARARASIQKYRSIVNLGERVELSGVNSQNSPPSTSDVVVIKDEPSDNKDVSFLSRSTGHKNGSESIVDVLKYELDCSSSSPDEDSVNVEVDHTDSGIEGGNTDAERETSVFQSGLGAAANEEIEIFFRGLLHYSEHPTLNNGLTMDEDLAFKSLEHQLKTYYHLNPKSRQFKRKSKMSANSTRGLRRVAIPTRSSARLASNIGPDSNETHHLRKLSMTSSGSELLDTEIISAEKAVLTAQKVKLPNKIRKWKLHPTPLYKYIIMRGKYIPHDDIHVPDDPEIRPPVTPPTIPEDPRLPLGKEETMEPQVEDCGKDFCRLGCICESIRGSVVRDHCVRRRCRLACVCITKVKIDEKEMTGTRSRRLPQGVKRKWAVGHSKNRSKPAAKLDSSTDAEDLPLNHRRLTDHSPNSQRDEDEDNYLGDVDRAESSSDAGTVGSFTTTTSRHIPIITIDSDDDVYVDENESECGGEDAEANVELAERRELRQKKNACQPCLVRTVEANLDLPVEQIEILCAPRVNYAEDRGDAQKIIRRLYMPLPLGMRECEDRTMCIVSVEENHNAIINWNKTCLIPRASKTSMTIAPNITLTTVITLPIPPLDETFFLFKIPPHTDGDLFLHVHDLQFMIPLDQLHDARAMAAIKGYTIRVQLVDRAQRNIRGSNGRPCEVFLFPSLSNVLVFGPFPAVSPTRHRMIKSTPTTSDVNRIFSNEIGVDSNWNGDGELIPGDYYENIFQDLMIEFPQNG